MRTADEHALAALALAPAPVSVELELRDALGHVTAAPVTASVDSPPFDNSAMDGFAVQWADVHTATADAPVTLALMGESRAGVPFAETLLPGRAIRIMTGAPMPAGADTVVPLEVTSSDDQAVTIREVRAEGAHVRRCGEDARTGDEVIGSGVELSARHLAAAAAVGASRVSVFRSPRVGILSTGDELAPLGATLAPGQIYESNSVLLGGAVRRAGGVPVLLGPVGDSVADVVAAIGRDDVDLIVTTGGVSVGAYDVIKAALAGLGVEFMTVAMQPGKPQGLGSVDGVPLLCLPGNPVSVAVSFELFVLPVIRAMRGLPGQLPWASATVSEGWSSPAGREQFMPVRWEAGSVQPATGRGAGSHLMARLALAEGLARVPADVTDVRVGDSLEFRRFAG
ncbi:gephyrin-like molybdotransferase Glp [Demequina sp.]|uniref:molybdopterin molybdotransferase MoeA n=1 Tax=Demequina sp. TaxID=2050685 RepID=UPI0025BFB7B5|nr:gephyrin-like molybdotransferase Glp [Demequina sp.]